MTGIYWTFLGMMIGGIIGCQTSIGHAFLYGIIGAPVGAFVWGLLDTLADTLGP